MDLFAEVKPGLLHSNFFPFIYMYRDGEQQYWFEKNLSNAICSCIS